MDYFIFRAGQYFGPFKHKEVLRQFEDGRLRPSDLIITSEAKNWRRVGEVFNHSKETETETETSSPCYVVLHQYQAGSYRTLGPFSQAQIKERLQNKSLRFIDYVWQDGWTEWRRIHDLIDFHHAKEAPLVPVDRRQFLRLNTWQELCANPWICASLAPEDAEGTDLLAQTGVRPLLS